MKKEKLSLVVLAIEIASIVALHSYKSEKTDLTFPAASTTTTQINVMQPLQGWQVLGTEKDLTKNLK